MKSQQLDQLFKDTLEDHTVRPQHDLWARIAAEKAQPPSTTYWKWYIAASVVLMITVGYMATSFIYPTDELQLEITLADNSYGPEESVEIIPVLELPVLAQVTPSIKNEQIAAANSSLIHAEPKAIEIQSPEPHPQITIYTTSDTVIDEAPVAVDATITTALASNKQRQGTKLVFDISQFDKSSQRTEEKKENKFKKIIKLAVEIKEGDSGLSDLREAKNSLFASGKETSENGR